MRSVLGLVGLGRWVLCNKGRDKGDFGGTTKNKNKTTEKSYLVCGAESWENKSLGIH